MKKILTLALMTLASISFASELSSFNGKYQLQSGDKDCFETVYFSASEKGVDFYGDLVDEVINADLSAVNAGKQIIHNSGARGAFELSYDEQESVLQYVEKGRLSLSEDGLALVPYKVTLTLEQNEDGTLNLDLKSMNTFRALGSKNMSCVYSK